MNEIWDLKLPGGEETKEALAAGSGGAEKAGAEDATKGLVLEFGPDGMPSDVHPLKGKCEITFEMQCAHAEMLWRWRKAQNLPEEEVPRQTERFVM